MRLRRREPGHPLQLSPKIRRSNGLDHMEAHLG